MRSTSSIEKMLLSMMLYCYIKCVLHFISKGKVLARSKAMATAGYNGYSNNS